MKIRKLVESLDYHLNSVSGSRITDQAAIECLLDREISVITDASRKVVPGCLFFCIKGAVFDGHDFAAGALENGACAIVVQSDLDLSGVVGVKALIEILRNADDDLIGFRSLCLCRSFSGLCRCISFSGLRCCFRRGCGAAALRCSFAAAGDQRTNHAYSKDSCQYSLFHKLSFHHCSPSGSQCGAYRPVYALLIVFHCNCFYKQRFCFCAIRSVIFMCPAARSQPGPSGRAARPAARALRSRAIRPQARVLRLRLLRSIRHTWRRPAAGAIMEHILQHGGFTYEQN